MLGTNWVFNRQSALIHSLVNKEVARIFHNNSVPSKQRLPFLPNHKITHVDYHLA